MAAKVEKIPGVISVRAAELVVSAARQHEHRSTILLKGADERGDINQMGATRLRAIAREYRVGPAAHQFPQRAGRPRFVRAHPRAVAGSRPEEAGRPGQRNQHGDDQDQSIVDVKANINLSNPEVQVNIDRARASDLGVRVSDIAGAVRLLMSGEDQISTYKEGAEQYPVTVRLMPGQRDDPGRVEPAADPLRQAGSDSPGQRGAPGAGLRAEPHRSFQPPVHGGRLRQRGSGTIR